MAITGWCKVTSRRQESRPLSLLVVLLSMALLLAPVCALCNFSSSYISLCGLAPPLPVLVIGILKHPLARQRCVQLGADEEGAAHLPVKRVGLFRRRGQPVLQHDGDEVVDALGGGLGAEIKGLARVESLPQDHDGVYVSVHHRL